MPCEDIYCGFWVNWEHGRCLGSTLTLPKISGSILSAFLIILIGSAGTNLWGIICYAAHQSRATPTEGDDVHHQIQVLLRNASNGWDVLVGLSELSWYRRRSTSAIIRALPLLLFSALYLTALAVAGLFSSRAITTGDQVLTQGEKCGWQGEVDKTSDLQSGDVDSLSTANALLLTTRSGLLKSKAYARACYGSDVDLLSSCNYYVRQKIDSAINFEAPCPFASGACAAPAISIDTGKISSDQHLGVNSLTDDKIYLRKITSCSPLMGEKYTDTINGTFKGYAFGPWIYSSSWSQYTFFIHNISDYFIYGDREYSLDAYCYFPGNTSITQFDPIPDLHPGDRGDLTILALMNKGVDFINEVKDPWFKADNFSSANYPWSWSARDIMSFLACVESYQVCIAESCSSSTGYYNIDKSNFASPLGDQNTMQNDIFRLLLKGAEGLQMQNVISILRKDILVANDYLWAYLNGLSAPLPDKQWQTEVMNIHNTSMAFFQRRIVEYASPPRIQVQPSVSSLDYIVPPNSSAALSLCSQIKIRTTAYTSFSVLGLILLISVSILIIATNLSLPKIVLWTRERLKLDSYKSFEWIETSAMQLHRIACEGRGIGPWYGKSEDLPRTQEVGLEFSLTVFPLEGKIPGSASDLNVPKTIPALLAE